MKSIVVATMLPANASKFQTCEEGPARTRQKILAASPMAKDIIVTDPYVCKIHSRRSIDVRALEKRDLELDFIKEGLEVKKGDLLFEIVASSDAAKPK